MTKGVLAVAKAIETSNSLTSFNLIGSNNAMLEGVRALAEAITKNTSLTSINFSDNHINPEGAKALAEAIEDSFIATNIQISGYEVSDIETTNSLSNSLSRNKERVIKLAKFLIKIGIEKVESQDEGGARSSSAEYHDPKTDFTKKRKINTQDEQDTAPSSAKLCDFETRIAKKKKIETQDEQDTEASSAEPCVLEVRVTKKSFDKMEVGFKDYAAFSFYQRCDQALLKSSILKLMQEQGFNFRKENNEIQEEVFSFSQENNEIQEEVFSFAQENDVIKLLRNTDNYIKKHWIKLTGIVSSSHKTDQKKLSSLPDDTLSLIAEYFPKAFLSKIISTKDLASLNENQQNEASLGAFSSAFVASSILVPESELSQDSTGLAGSSAIMHDDIF